jgi:hypothetical protein
MLQNVEQIFDQGCEVDTCDDFLDWVVFVAGSGGETWGKETIGETQT